MKTVVGVLRGGPSSEYEVSLKSGANVLSALNQEKYEPVDIFIDRRGQWHLFGAPVLPERALRDSEERMRKFAAILSDAHDKV